MMFTMLTPIVLADDATCPYDADYKFVLQKALINYFENPQNSLIQKEDLIKMLNFYLSQSTITNADCSQGDITSLLSQADDGISDEVLSALKCSGSNCNLPKCDACADGTACGGTNDRNQTCSCTDIDGDGQSEFCHLKPVRPTWPTCDMCYDGTACGDDNPYNQTCICKDINNDNNNEYCFLQASNQQVNSTLVGSWSTCDTCPDGTACGQTNANGNACICYDKRRNGSYSHCMMKCDSCSDGTQCGDTNQNNELCGCRIRSHYGQFRECELMCDQCSDGTECWRRNSQGDRCICTGYYGRGGYYNQCNINSNTTTTTAVTTTIIGTTTTGVTTTTLATTTTTIIGTTTTTSITTTTSVTTTTSIVTTTSIGTTTTELTTTTLATTTTTSGTTTTTQTVSCDPESLAKAVSMSEMYGWEQAIAVPREFCTTPDANMATYMANQMTAIGLTNVHTETFPVSFTDSRYGPGTITGTGINVVGDLGNGSTIIVIGAHHDAVPPNCTGAVDNGAGSAGILEVAKTLMACKDSIKSYTLRFVSFDGEEANGDYWGSHAYVNAHTHDNNPTMINIDCLGDTHDQGLTVYTSSSSVSLSTSATKACTYMKTLGMTVCNLNVAGNSIESDPYSFYNAGKEYIYPIDDTECGTTLSGTNDCNHCVNCADDLSSSNFDENKMVWGVQYVVYIVADSYFK